MPIFIRFLMATQCVTSPPLFWRASMISCPDANLAMQVSDTSSTPGSPLALSNASTWCFTHFRNSQHRPKLSWKLPLGPESSAALTMPRSAGRISAGQEEQAARCGILEVAGITVGAAFVGTVASTLVVADILRLLHGGENYSVIGLDLRMPRGIHAVHSTAPGTFAPPSWTPTL